MYIQLLYESHTTTATWYVKPFIAIAKHHTLSEKSIKDERPCFLHYKSLTLNAIFTLLDIYCQLYGLKSSPSSMQACPAPCNAVSLCILGFQIMFFTLLS